MTTLTTTNYELKKVQFNNVSMIAIKTEDGKIFTSVKKICEDLGITTNGQVERIKRDEILKEGVRIIRVPSEGGNQDTLCLDIECLPFWLTGIQANRCKDEVKTQLVEFKKKAQKMLSDAFIQSQPNQTPQLPINYIEALEKLLSSEKEKLQLQAKIEQDKPKIETYNQIMTSNTALDFSAVAKMFNTGRNRLFKLCREKGYLRANNEPYQEYIDSGLFETIIVNKRTESDFNQNFIKPLITPKGIEKITELLSKV